MTHERDTTRIVRSWLQDGSTSMPDRVLDAVLAELPSTPQQRSWWPLRRIRPMKALITLTGAAAAIALAVVLGSRFLPLGDVGAPGPGGPIAGQVTFSLGDSQLDLDVDAVADGSSLTGTAVATNPGSMVEIGFECVGMLDDTTWLLGGSVEAANEGGVPIGDRAAVVVRDGEIQQLVLWFEESSATTTDCPTFLDSIPDDVTLSPALSGGLTLPE